MLVGAAVGCTGGESPSTSFEHHGPHGGHTAVMSDGAGFAVEFTLDPERQRMVLYVQEPGGSRPHPLATDSLSGRFKADGKAVDVTFAADPRPDDPPGSSSRFALGLDRLPQQLQVSDRFVLKLSYVDAGRTVTASVAHNNDHGHKYRHD